MREHPIGRLGIMQLLQELASYLKTVQSTEEQMMDFNISCKIPLMMMEFGSKTLWVTFSLFFYVLNH
jgi:hypothetical protein